VYFIIFKWNIELLQIFIFELVQYTFYSVQIQGYIARLFPLKLIGKYLLLYNKSIYCWFDCVQVICQNIIVPNITTETYTQYNNYTIILCCPCYMPKYVPRLEGIMYDPEGTYTQYNNVQYAYYINTLISNLVRVSFCSDIWYYNILAYYLDN
jgi:hypothetical protein